MVVKKTNTNLLDAISQGANEGFKIALNVVAMLLGFLALIYLLDYGLGKAGMLFGLEDLSLQNIFGFVFSGFAWLMGVPAKDMHAVGGLMGTKLAVNEFVAYLNLKNMEGLAPISTMIATFALCGFANFSSIAIQVGGIGQIAPERRKDLAKLWFKALLCGTLANYLSATIAGLLFSL